jgi:ABC-type transport system involved in multi-copper enzyme maturation permease subunit
MGAYVGVLALVVAYAYPNEIRLEPGRNPELGRDIFLIFSFAQALLVAMLTPAIASTALTLEREKQTLESLVVSGLSVTEIVTGKFFYSLFHVFLLMISSLPLTSVSFMLGGVSAGELIGVYGAILLGAAVLAAASVLCSSFFHRSYVATAMSYLSVPLTLSVVGCFMGLGLMLAIPFVGLALASVGTYWASRKGSNRSRILTFFVGVPIAAVLITMLIVEAAMLIKRGGWESLAPILYFLFCIPGCALLCWLCLSTAAYALQRLPEPRVPTRRRWEAVLQRRGTQDARRKTQDEEREGEAPAEPMVSAGASPSHALSHRRPTATYGARPFISENANPVFAKEMRASLFGKKEHLIRALAAATIGTELLLILLCFSPSFVMNGEPYFRGWAILDIIAVMTVGAAFAGLSVSMEKEQRTLHLLFMTPLSSHTIVSGKFYAVAFYTAYIIVASVPVVAFCAALDIVSLSEAGVFFISQIVYGAAAVGMGLLYSVISNQSRRAVGWALGTMLALMLGSLFLPLLAPPNWQATLFAPSWNMDAVSLSFIALSTILPLTNAHNALGAMARGGTTSAVDYLPLWCVAMLLYLFVAVVCYGLSIYVFERRIRTAE